MIESKSPAVQTRGENQDRLQIDPSGFEIENLQTVAYGRIRAQFDLKVGPVTIECNLVVDEDGRPKFIAPQSVCDRYSNGYRQTATLERDFALRVFEAVAERLQAQE